MHSKKIYTVCSSLLPHYATIEIVNVKLPEVRAFNLMHFKGMVARIRFEKQQLSLELYLDVLWQRVVLREEIRRYINGHAPIHP